MHREEAKLNFVRIFSETKYESVEIDDTFVCKYVAELWKALYAGCVQTIKTGMTNLSITDWSVYSTMGLNFPSHERIRVYNVAILSFQRELIDSKVPFTTKLNQYNNTIEFQFAISDLRRFSNIETLGAIG